MSVSFFKQNSIKLGDPKESSFGQGLPPFTIPLPSARYWRYLCGTATDGHHPRVSRIMLMQGVSSTTIVTFTGDNCGDSGTIPGNGNSYSYDFGPGDVAITDAKTYNVYGGGSRGANVSIQSSPDNSTWTTRYSGIMSSAQSPTPLSCGLHSIYQLIAV